MLFMLLLSAVLTLAVSATYKSAHFNTEVSKDVDYNYFDFVRQWSPNSCYQAQHHCKKLDPALNYWTIHGLWPSYNATSYPSDCKKCHFDPNAFEKIADEMHKRWPTDYSGGDTKFWSHEYCKHGTCCADLLPTELDYFSMALELNKKLDVDVALQNAGITPSKTKHYTFSQVQQAMKSAFGVDDATYWCRNADHKQLLFQIAICIDKSLQTRNCPTAAHMSCNNESPVYILPFDALYEL